MIRRFVIALTAALLLEATVFALYYEDLLFLRRPASEIAAEPVETFRTHAESALGRDRLTVRHLDTMADAAERLGQHDLEVRARERRVQLTDTDPNAHLQLADALRRAGRLADAERHYLAILNGSTPQ